MTVYKYVMDEHDKTFLMPRGTKILSVQMQGKNPSIWALVDQNKNADDPHRFIAFDTGQQIDFHSEKLSFIGTVIDNNYYVSHIFEVFL